MGCGVGMWVLVLLWYALSNWRKQQMKVDTISGGHHFKGVGSLEHLASPENLEEPKLSAGGPKFVAPRSSAGKKWKPVNSDACPDAGSGTDTDSEMWNISLSHHPGPLQEEN